MARPRHESVTQRAEQQPPPGPKKPDDGPRPGPGWAIFFTVWGVMFSLLLVYELWGFFKALLWPRR